MKRINPWWILSLGISVLGMVYLLAPIVVVFPLAFSSGEALSYPIPGFSMRWYEQIIQPFPWIERLRNSLIVGTASMVVSAVVGTLAAYGLFLANFRAKSVLLAIFLAPIIVPSVITGLGMFYTFSAMRINGTFPALILAHSVLAAPFVLITVNATLAGFDFQLARAAQSLGASPTAAFRQVTLPLIMPGIISGAIFAFIVSFDEIVVTLFVASSKTLTLPIQLFTSLRDQMTPVIVAIAVLLVIGSVFLGALANFFQRMAGRYANNKRNEA